MFYSSIIPRPLNNCFHCLKLKQGTVLIAIVQLIAAGIAVTFYILALTHAVDIREMVAQDAEDDALDRGFFEDDTSMRLNIKRMEIAGCNAKGKVDEIWFHLMFGLTHLSFIILLLYGVLTNRRRFMEPWICMNIIHCATVGVLLVRNKDPLNLETCMFICIFCSAALLHLYSIYVVWSTYMSLNMKKGLIHEILLVKKKEKPQSVSESSTSRLTKPYEV